ncbi:hypothetical protein ACCS93_35980 [Rhizobium ruizarguesonis]
MKGEGTRKRKRAPDYGEDREMPPTKRARPNQTESDYGSDLDPADLEHLEAELGQPGQGRQVEESHYGSGPDHLDCERMEAEFASSACGSDSEDSKLPYKPLPPPGGRAETPEFLRESRRLRQRNPNPPAIMQHDDDFIPRAKGEDLPRVLVELNHEHYISIMHFSGFVDPEHERDPQLVNNKLGNRMLLIATRDGRSYLSPATLARQDPAHLDATLRLYNIDPVIETRRPLRKRPEILMRRDKHSFVSGEMARAYMLRELVDLRDPQWQKEKEHEIFASHSRHDGCNDYSDLAAFRERHWRVTGERLVLRPSQLDTLRLGLTNAWSDIPDPRLATPETDFARAADEPPTPPPDASGASYFSKRRQRKLIRQLPDYERSGLEPGPKGRPEAAEDPLEDQQRGPVAVRLWAARMRRFFHDPPLDPPREPIVSGAAPRLTASCLDQLEEAFPQNARAALSSHHRGRDRGNGL